MPALDALNQGPSGSLRFARNAGRSLHGEALGAIRYPSPFFDISHTYLPTSFKSMLRWCRYYFLTNPLINAVCYKMAEYPVTDLVFDSDNENENKRWSDFFDKTLHWKSFEVEAGLDYNVYGNAFISVHFPFRKLLVCNRCGHTVKVTQQKYTFRDYSFAGECQRCHHYGEFKVKDHYVRSVREIRLIRWNPEYITIEHNEATGENRYYYIIPPSLSNDIHMAKRHVIENIPQVFVEALRKNKALIFSKNNIYHMQRPTIAQKDRGWGMPMILPVLKDTFYLQVLRKAQEAIAVEHIVPLRVLFPQSASSTGDVYTTVNLSQWKDKIENEIIRWRLDNNYIPIMPVPIGQQTLGGDGRALMLSQEHRQWSEHIVAGMGVPIEFVFGGMQYCQSLDTYVFTDKGMVQLKDLVPEACEETALGEGTIATGRGVHKVGGVHNTGMKKAARVRTRLGLDATPSHDHRYRVLTDDMDMVWKRTSELQPGDRVAVQAGMNTWPKALPDLPDSDFNYERDVTQRYPVAIPKHLSQSLARLLGYLVSEGSSSLESDRIGFAQVDASVMADFLECNDEVFGYVPGTWGSDGVRQTEIARRPAVRFLHELGVVGKSHEKQIPGCILRAPKDIVCNFLRGYFEGDGSASTTQGKQMVSCSSKSEELLKQIQLLLLNLGVVSSRYYDDKRGMWQLQVRSEYVDVYAKEVGFVSVGKRTEIAVRTPTAKTHLGERIPYLKERLDLFRKKHFDGRSAWEFEKVGVVLTKEEYTVREVASILGRDPTTVHYHIKQGRISGTRVREGYGGQFGTTLISREGLQHFLQEYGVGKRKSVPGRDAWGMTYSKLSASDLTTIREKEPDLAYHIEAIAKVGYVWDEVLDVELFDFEVPMGDLTVNVDHSYIADGMVTHNSGSNVSMRILENHFLDVKTQRKMLIDDFVMPNVAAFMDWNVVPCHYKKFKMADDLQRSAFYLQLAQAGKLSDKSLLEDTDWNSTRERDRIEEERKYVIEAQRKQALDQAGIQGEAQLIMAKYQMRGQKLMNELTPEAAPMGMPAQPPMGGVGQPGMSPESEGQMMNEQTAAMNQAGQVPPMEIPPQMGPPPGQEQVPPSPPPMGMEGAQSQVGSQAGGWGDLAEIAQKVADRINKLPDNEKHHELVKMQIDNPQLYSLILPLLRQTAGAESNSAAMPQPEQKSPRRGPEAVVA